MTYATFWQRFAAMWIDFFVFVPITLLDGWLESFSRPLAFAMVIPMGLSYCAYDIYCHGQFGKTIGKHVMKVRVVNTNGNAIGWKAAYLRSSVDIVFSTLGIVSSFIALATISDTNYYGIGWLQRAATLSTLAPSWLAWTTIAGQIWVGSEVVIMLFNKRRRALHDFMAGTVVLSEKPCAAQSSDIPRTA